MVLTIPKLITRFIKLTLALFFALILLIIYARFIEPNMLTVHHQKISIAQLPKAFTGLKIVQISDLHGKEYRGSSLINKINQLHPDLLVVTGDILDRSHQDYQYITKVLGLLQAPMGKFFVAGNNDHSHALSYPMIQHQLQLANTTELANKAQRLTLGQSHLWLVGVDDPNTGRAQLDAALKGTDSAPKILLAHSPEIVNQAAEENGDLVLVGHTHGGQVWIPGVSQRPGLKAKVDRVIVKLNQVINWIIGEVWERATTDLAEPEVNLPKVGKVVEYNMQTGFEQYLAGHYQVKRTQLYVNRGIGVTRVAFRLFAPPEITVIELVGK